MKHMMNGNNLYESIPFLTCKTIEYRCDQPVCETWLYHTTRNVSECNQADDYLITSLALVLSLVGKSDGIGL